MIIHAATSSCSVSPAAIEARPILHAYVVPRSALEPSVVTAMYRLYADNYADTAWSLFQQDLATRLEDNAYRLPAGHAGGNGE